MLLFTIPCPGVCNSVSDPDPHKEMPPGSESAWTDADPDPEVKKPRKCTGSLGENRTVILKFIDCLLINDFLMSC